MSTIANDIDDNTRISTHCPVGVMERGLLNVWVNPNFSFRETLDAGYAISGDQIAKLTRGAA